MSWLEKFTVGLVLTTAVVCVASYAYGYAEEWMRLRGRSWLAWRAQRPRFDGRDLGRFRRDLALWKGHRP